MTTRNSARSGAYSMGKSSSKSGNISDEFIPGEDGFNGDRALWRAVITQALMDAGSDSKKPEMKYEKAQAIAWLSGTSRDFHTVCGLAELDPEYVREKAREAIRKGCKWRMDASGNIQTIQERKKHETRTIEQSPFEVKSLVAVA